MSLALAAKHLESQGRGNDSHLVHMTTGELQSLRGLAKAHGGEITINPRTGLPEAGFLSSILPTVLGIAGTAMGIPMPYLIGGIGLGTAAITGDIKQGLMAGLGAWGGASLGKSIMGAAGEAAKQGAHLGGNVVKEVADDVVMNTAQSLPSGATGQIGMHTQFPNAVAGNAVADVGLSNIPMAGGQVGMANSFPAAMGGAGPVTAASKPGFFDSFMNIDKTAPERFQAGFEVVKENPLQFVKDNPFTVAGAAMPFVNELLKPNAYKPPEKEKNPFGLKYLSKDFQGSFPAQPRPAYQAQYRDYVTNPYTTYAAGGGLQTANYARGDLVKYGLGLLNQKQDQAPITATDPGAGYSPAYNSLGIMPYEKDTENMSSDQMAKSILKQAKTLGKLASKASVMMPDPADTAISSIQREAPAMSAKEGGLQGYALGGLSMGHLGGYSDGGRLLKGPGDGVSDSIPASIGAKQPARLAEGEFVIPARIVSELGNGSTDAGAKRLYAMMDRVKAKRAKTKNIAADSKAYKYLPA
jgi:hypothetical protein